MTLILHYNVQAALALANFGKIVCERILHLIMIYVLLRRKRRYV